MSKDFIFPFFFSCFLVGELKQLVGLGLTIIVKIKAIKILRSGFYSLGLTQSKEGHLLVGFTAGGFCLAVTVCLWLGKKTMGFYW